MYENSDAPAWQDNIGRTGQAPFGQTKAKPCAVKKTADRALWSGVALPHGRHSPTALLARECVSHATSRLESEAIIR
jgi:hypothetical protein